MKRPIAAANRRGIGSAVARNVPTRTESERCVGLTLVCALAFSAIGEPEMAMPEPRTYSQEIAVQFASAKDAARASVSLAPVWDNRKWAFSARWDDNNANSLNMRERMAKYGLKGTFYLNQAGEQTRYGSDYARRLMQDGFSIGGHTQTHPKLPEVSPSKAFYEIMANRVERECQTDQPMNSFAFPFGQYQSKDSPVALEQITNALRRAGYHHCVYQSFLRNNPHLNKNEFSTGLQVVPGDREVNAAKFQESLAKIFKWPEAYAKVSRCIFLGVHAWQKGGEWDKLESVFKTLADRDDWWYCNLTEYAAYERQYHFSRIEARAAQSSESARTYTLKRPEPAELGASVPLTLLIQPAPVRTVSVGVKPVEFRSLKDAVVVNLPHPADKALPAKIGHVPNPKNLQELTEGHETADFPGARFLLAYDAPNGRLVVTAENKTGSELSDIWITSRLPLKYRTGILRQRISTMPPDTSETIAIALPDSREEAVWSEGPHYHVAEIDFRTPQGPGRIFATTRVD